MGKVFSLFKPADEPDNVSLNLSINCSNVCCAPQTREVRRHAFRDLLQSKAFSRIRKQREVETEQRVESESSKQVDKAAVNLRAS